MERNKKMKTFNMEVTDKRLTFPNPDEEVIVCGNGDYQIKFTFDAEWNAHSKKTARFTWNGEHHHVEFTGNTCVIPMVTNTGVVTVGVFAGEDGVDNAPLATTKVSILCIEGSRCGDSTPNAGSGGNYTNEARGYAEEAKKYAEALENAAGLEWKPFEKHDLWYSYDYVDEENNYETVYVEVNRGYADPAPMLADPGVYLVKISYWGMEKIFMILVPSNLTQNDIYSTVLRANDGNVEYLTLHHLSDERANVDIDELTGTDTYAFSEWGDGKVYYAKLG